MKKLVLALAMASTLPVLTATPVAAQSSSERYRFNEAQRRYDRETQIYQAAVDRYQSRGGRVDAYNNGYRRSDGTYNNGAYNNGTYNNGDRRSADDRYENGYDPSRYYKDGNYDERTLSSDDRVYRGSDGQYYCKRSDGTTGLVIGAVGGGVLGNVIDGGHSRAVGTAPWRRAGRTCRSLDRAQSEQRPLSLD